MDPACLVVLASICLPTESLKIEVVSSPVGSMATITTSEYKAYVRLVSDTLGIEERNWSVVCERDLCLKYNVRRRTDVTGQINIGLDFYEPSAGEEQHLSISARNPSGIRQAVRTLRIRVGDGKATIPLGQLVLE